MKFLRAFGNSPRQIGRILSNRNIKHLHQTWLHQRPASVILYSPQKLDLSVSQCISSLDFKPVYDWLKYSECFDLKEAMNSADELITPEKFETIVNVAFNTLLDPFRSQSDSDPETVLFYYTGHGFKISKDATMMTQKFNYIFSPDLHSIGISKEILKPAARYIKRKRPLKGGEFCLHQFGYCDLQSLLERWTTALTKQSTKKNKHLIVIADSCYSGMFVKDLKKLARTPAPWNQNGCTVTVQSACRSDETSLKTLFSPYFVHFNKPENRKRLRDLEKKWNGMRDEDKNKMRKKLHGLRSPQVATTIPLDKWNSNVDRLTMEFHQFPGYGFPLTLFPDADFFNFCLYSLGPCVVSCIAKIARRYP